MSVNFLNADCQKTTNEARFGLYDSDDQTPTKITLTKEATWNATVLNNQKKDLLFTAIDNCIAVLKENGEMDARCDCMINYDSTLLLIELKNKRDSWQTEGLFQIENIIKIMIRDFSEKFFAFKTRKAIVANRKHQFPSFNHSNIEQRQYFMSKYKTRIQFEAEIIIA